MMEYEIFKEVVAEKLKDYLPENMQGMKMDVRPVEKVNKTLDGISFFDMQARESHVSPTIYINNMYEDYKRSNDLDGTLRNAADVIGRAMEESRSFSPDLDLSGAKDKIVFQLINTEQNRDMLAGMPNRQFQDLSIIYRWVIDSDRDGMKSVVIRNSLAEQMELTEEQLFKLAAENTRRIMPPSVKNMNDVIREMFMKDGMPQEMADMIGEIPQDKCMWVISNEQGINGAISMLYEDKLQKLANELESDLYIMPSSIHEVIAVSTDMGDPVELAEMVAQINMDQVALEERLSNQVYHYDKDLRKLTLATDTPNKRLDGMVAETALIYAGKEQSR